MGKGNAIYVQEIEKQTKGCNSYHFVQMFKNGILIIRVYIRFIL